MINLTLYKNWNPCVKHHAFLTFCRLHCNVAHSQRPAGWWRCHSVLPAALRIQCLLSQNCCVSDLSSTTGLLTNLQNRKHICILCNVYLLRINSVEFFSEMWNSHNTHRKMAVWWLGTCVWIWGGQTHRWHYAPHTLLQGGGLSLSVCLSLCWSLSAALHRCLKPRRCQCQVSLQMKCKRPPRTHFLLVVPSLL